MEFIGLALVIWIVISVPACWIMAKFCAVGNRDKCDKRVD